MHARSALFDVYGDHLRAWDNQAPVAALVRLLAPVGIAAPAVRTAISRMVIQEWLEPVTIAGGRGYRATPQAIRRLDEAADRIYRRTEPVWDGTWHLVFVTPPTTRAGRSKVRADLRYLGYGELTADVWVSPYRRSELVPALARADVRVRTACASDVDPPPTEAWDLAGLAAAYERWLDQADDLVAQHASPGDTSTPEHGDEAAFAARFHLVHEWRKFLFADPGLPDQLLPDPWPGHAAAARFAEHAGRLQPGADRFVARCLDT